MPSFSDNSARRLATCDPLLQALFNRVVEQFDCTVLEGERTVDRQRKLMAEGKSRTMDSKHLSRPSRAVDVAPYPVDWRDTERFYYFGGYVKAIADELGIGVRWGGDWDGDHIVKDQEFNDLVHFELTAIGFNDGF